MKSFTFFITLGLIFMGSSSFTNIDSSEENRLADIEFNLSVCSQSFDDNVTTYEIKDGDSEVGYSIWISRKSKKVKAKYFAYKYSGSDVYDRYEEWRADKEVVLMSSGAYASGDTPVGVTVDFGNIVNRKYDNLMDALVIVYATGGIVVSNAEDGDLKLAALGRTVDIRESTDRSLFLAWAESQKATVFQTHLLAYKNELRFYKDNGEKAKRKFLVLATSPEGELFHIIFYTKYKSYSLFDATEGLLNYFKEEDMDVTAIVNLDTGMYDIVGTGGDAKDCEGEYLSGTKDNRDDMTNLLAYEFIE